jgi:hypothetical protein
MILAYILYSVFLSIYQSIPETFALNEDARLIYRPRSHGCMVSVSLLVQA